MDLTHSCSCCLRCSADRDLTTPYTHLGTTEIYSDMLKECFDIHLPMGNDGSCGICAACVGRLRDASAFKLQVQRSQAELQARLQGALLVKEEEPTVELETEDGDGSSEEPVLDEKPSVKLEMLDIHETDVFGSKIGAGARASDDEPMWHSERAVKAEESEASDKDCISHSERAVKAEESETSDEDCISLAPDGCAGWPVSALASSHLAMTCLRGDEAPQASHTSLPTLRQSRRASRMKETHDNTAGHRAEEAYTCDTCGRQFIGKLSLIAHVRRHLAQDESENSHKRIHTGVKPYSCGECKKQFTQKVHLDEHKRIHTGVKPYSCGECKKQFTRKARLNEHKRIHAGVYLYSCGECKKQFTQKVHLDEHKRIHTGVKPYICGECKMQFSRKSNLDRHKKNHTGVKPYSCGECKKQFTQRGSLDRHKKSHTGVKPYSCKECKMQFTQKTSLDRHNRIHTGVNLYRCEVCNKPFRSKYEVVKHTEKVHSEEQSFMCEICESLFSSKSKLMKHIRIHNL